MLSFQISLVFKQIDRFTDRDANFRLKFCASFPAINSHPSTGCLASRRSERKAFRHRLPNDIIDEEDDLAAMLSVVQDGDTESADTGSADVPVTLAAELRSSICQPRAIHTS